MDADKQTMILDAAFDAFIRHGFRRVTMGEIARAAGMSRPALYLEFANKEDIFTAVLRRYSDDLLSEIQAGLKARNTPADQLMFVCDIWVVRPFEMVQQGRLPLGKGATVLWVGMTNDQVSTLFLFP